MNELQNYTELYVIVKLQINPILKVKVIRKMV